LARQKLSQASTSACPKSRKRSFDSNALAVNSVRSHPAIASPPVISDLKSLPLPRLDQIEVLVAIDLAKDDVAHFHLFGFCWHDGTELARINLALHRIPAWTELNGFALLQLINVNSRPAHRFFGPNRFVYCLCFRM